MPPDVGVGDLGTLDELHELATTFAEVGDAALLYEGESL